MIGCALAVQTENDHRMVTGKVDYDSTSEKERSLDEITERDKIGKRMNRTQYKWR